MADPLKRAQYNVRRRGDYQRSKNDPEIREKRRRKAAADMADPAFRERNRLRQAKRRRLHLERVRAIERASHKRRKRRAEAELIALVRAAIPSAYPRDVRDDIAGEMCLALAERKLRRRDVANRVKEFISAYWKMHPRAGVLSLDAPAYPGGPTLIERVADPTIEMAAV
jgi:hypothetical protein